jgi:hypothetical protein
LNAVRSNGSRPSCDAKLIEQKINRSLVPQLADDVLIGKSALEPLGLIGLDSLAPFDPDHVLCMFSWFASPLEPGFGQRLVEKGAVRRQELRGGSCQKDYG